MTLKDVMVTSSTVRVGTEPIVKRVEDVIVEERLWLDEFAAESGNGIHKTTSLSLGVHLVADAGCRSATIIICEHTILP